jgi:glycosyltransferase involved in cell wall biosynthesis
MPEVSIIMPSYNHRAFIGEAIESVIAQRFGDWELLIVDNASQDNSQELIQQYQTRDGRIRAVFNKTNLQTAQAVNQGFDQACAQHLMILTSDDVIPPERLDHQLTAIQTPGNENKVIVGRWVDIDSQGRVLSNPFYGRTWEGFELKRHGDIFESQVLAGFTYISMQTLLFTREHVADVRFDERFPLIANEYKFVLDLASRFLFHAMDEIVFIHRIHGDNQSCQWDRDQELHEKAVIGRELLVQHSHRLSAAAQKRQLDCVLYDALRRRNIPDIRNTFLKQLALNPVLLQTTLDHYRHQRQGHVPLPCAQEGGIPHYTLADTGIALADLKAIHEDCSLTVFPVNSESNGRA